MIGSTPTLKTDSDGTRRRSVNGKWHRTDGPAIEWADGSREWYLNGKLHRTEGPAVENTDGGKSWWVNGQRHRIDGPAIEDPERCKEWYLSGKRHRPDSPAIEEEGNYKAWFINGERHRVDGPAVEWAVGQKEWWVNDKETSKPYSHVLTAAYSLGLPMPEKVLRDMFKAMAGADGSQNHELNQLNIILNKYWPLDVKKILSTLFMDPDPTIKHIAFSLLGREESRASAQGRVRL